MGPCATQNCVIINFNKSTPIVLSIIKDRLIVDKNGTNWSLASKDIALVVGTSSGRRQTFGVEASLKLHFWTSGALPTPAFTIIVHLPSHLTVQMYMAALYVTVKKTSALVPRKVDEAWGQLLDHLVIKWRSCTTKQLTIYSKL